MATSDFVLDEGLDDDEDVLAFYSEQNQEATSPTHPQLVGDTSTPNDPQPNAQDVPPSPKPTIPSDCTAVILDHMPLQSSHKDVDKFLHGCGQITALKVRHFESRGYMQARVTFDTHQAVHLAVRRSGTPFGLHHSSEVSVHPAKSPPVSQPKQLSGSPQDGPAAFAKKEVDKITSALPDSSAVSFSFWSMFGAAKKAAGALEDRAKQLGEHLESQLHVSEKVEETRQRLAAMDNEYHVSERVNEAAAAGRATAGELDKKIGISKGVGAVADSVGSAAKIVVREVDENLDLSGKARQATNAALQNDSLGSTMKSVVASIGGVGSPRLSARPEVAVSTPENVTPRRKKNYQPSGIEPETLNMDEE